MSHLQKAAIAAGVYLTPEQVAGVLHVGLSCLAKWRSAGRGPVYLKMSNRVLYREADVRVFAERNVVQTEQVAA